MWPSSGLQMYLSLRLGAQNLKVRLGHSNNKEIKSRREVSRCVRRIRIVVADRVCCYAGVLGRKGRQLHSK